MVRKSFKEVMKDDVNNTFMNVDEFADMHTVDGKEIPVLVDDNEIIEREKKMKSNMDGVYVKQKLFYFMNDEQHPFDWALQDEESFPYFFGAASMTFATAAIRKEDRFA